jgi:hypothetical protein
MKPVQSRINIVRNPLAGDQVAAEMIITLD